MSNFMPQTQLDEAPRKPRYMDREGKRWTLRDVRPFFVPNFIQAVREEDGTAVVVHRSDFQRTQKG